MMFALIAGGVAVWVLLSVAAALLLGRTVHVADRRRPRTARTRRAAAALGRVVELATGSIPTIRPRLAAITGAIPIIRARVD